MNPILVQYDSIVVINSYYLPIFGRQDCRQLYHAKEQNRIARPSTQVLDRESHHQDAGPEQQHLPYHGELGVFHAADFGLHHLCMCVAVTEKQDSFIIASFASAANRCTLSMFPSNMLCRYLSCCSSSFKFVLCYGNVSLLLSRNDSVVVSRNTQLAHICFLMTNS